MQSFLQLSGGVRAVAAVLAGLVVFLIFDQFHWWKRHDEYMFGMIVPFFVGFVVFDRWPRIYRILTGKRLGEKPDKNLAKFEERLEKTADSPADGVLVKLTTAVAFCAVLGGLVFYVFGSLYRAMEGANLVTSTAYAYGFPAILLGTVFLLSRRTAADEPIPYRHRLMLTGMFLFPALIWMLSVPMFDVLNRAVSTTLMNQVATIVYHTFDFLGYAIVREGSVLLLPSGEVGVEDACSGIRSLTACLFAGSFIGAVFFESFTKKVVMVGMAMVFAFINNILRSLFLTGYAYGLGPGALEGDLEWLGINLGNIHDFTGWVVLGLTVVVLLVLVKIFSIRFEFEVDPAGGARASA